MNNFSRDELVANIAQLMLVDEAYDHLLEGLDPDERNQIEMAATGDVACRRADLAAASTKLPVKYVKSDHAVSVDRYLDALGSIKDTTPVFASDSRLNLLADQTYMAKVWERNEAGIKVAVEREHTIFGTTPLAGIALDDIISRRIETQTLQGGQNNGEKKWLPAEVPTKVSATILSRASSAKAFRRLNGIIGCPSLRPDGSLLIRPGYDADSGYYLACDVGATRDINEWLAGMLSAPTEGQARSMLKHLRHLLSGFPFHDVEGGGRVRTLYEYDEEPVSLSESVALAGLLTSVCRPMFDVVPGFCISANGYGVGKTFLSELIGYVATGRLLPSYFWSASKEENDKLLTTLLLNGITFGILDNINGGVANTLLGQMITTQRPEPRILGVNKTVSVMQWLTLFLNGVNIAPTQDLERRLLYLSMMTNLERPQDRQFRFNPMALAQRNRGQYLLAVLTIVRWHMMTSGQLPRGTKELGGFGDWSSAIVGALMRLDCPNPILTQERIKDNSAAATGDTALFRALRDQFGSEAVTSDAIRDAAVANPNGPLYKALMGFKGRDPALPSAFSIGKILGNRANTIQGGLQLRRSTSRVNVAMWWVAPPDVDAGDA